MTDLGEKGSTEHQEYPAEEEERAVTKQWDPAFIAKTTRKVDWMILPILTLLYLCSSLDKANLGNAKSLGMIEDIGGDKTGKKYAFLNSLYYVSYAPFMVPFALLGKRTRMGKTLAVAACFWGIAATCFAAVNNFGGSYACRFLIGLGEAAFVPSIQVYLSRFYTRQKLGKRVAIWLAMGPMGGFFNGIIAYGVDHINSDKLESWRILFLIEGGATLVCGAFALYWLPEHIDTWKWLSAEEKEFLMYERSLDYAAETNQINWKHVVGTFYHWPQVIPCLMNMCQQITGAALSAYLPTFTSENGFKGANAQIATLAPYGSAAVAMIACAYASDKQRNRGLWVQVGWVIEVLGFAMYLGLPATNHKGRFAALIFGEVGHYICTPLIVTWQANNSGSESRRAVAVPLAVACAQAVSIGSGYLFPKTDGPKYTKGSAIIMALSIAGGAFTGLYQIMIVWENRKRDRKEGKPEPGFMPDTATYADDAPGFRYMN
ncbi:hypothetical protein IAU60_006415 [Kwoniella sp. DSM 27419]